MPLIVTTTTPDAPPAKVVSVDGTLTVTADPDNGGVLVRANYASSWGAFDDFNTGTANWSVGNDATVTRTTSSPINGSGSLLWTRTQTVSSIIRTLPTFPAKPYEQKVMVSFTAKTTNSNTAALSMGWGDGSNDAGIVGPVARPMFTTMYVDANATPSNQLVFTTFSDAATNVVLDDVTVELQPPTSVYMYRNGKPLRGASPAPAADGIAYGYDYESTFGEASTWTAQPAWEIRNTEVKGEAGSGVSLVVPDLAGALNMSLKSLNQPSLSRKVIGKWPAATRSWEGRNNVSANPGASLSSGSWDVPVAKEETWVMETTTRQEATDLEDLLKSGPLLVQHVQVNRRPDIFALVTSFSADYKRGPVWPEMLWTVAFLPVATPTSVGSPALIPQRSYADVETVGTYASVLSSFGTYDAILTPVTVQAGAGFGIANYGVLPYGV